MAPHRSRKKRRIPDATATPAPAVASDALLSLPPEVLDEILARLDLRDAVRTSALCRAWRRRWESLPSLNISTPFGQQPIWTVDSVLPRCSGRVRRFHVFLDELSARRLDDWLLVLSRRGGVEDLDLSPNPCWFFSLHSTVFTWRRLISMELFACHIPPLPPDFEGFPALKVLSLANVKFQHNGEYQLEEIIETSPLLEKLILCEVCIIGDDFIEWEIRAPNLRHITICSNIDYGWNFAELPCLHSAVIDLWEYLGNRDFAKFLAGLVQVRKLRLCMFYAPVNGIKILETLPCTFDNLKSLKLFMHFCELPPILLVFCFLRSIPNLEKLKIRIYDGKEQKIEANGEFLNAQWTDCLLYTSEHLSAQWTDAQWTDGMCANLQILEMAGINWLPNEMSFMKLILSKARLLHTLSISHDDDCSVSHVDPLHELVTYGRASAQAQELLLDDNQYADMCSGKLLDGRHLLRITRIVLNFYAGRISDFSIRINAQSECLVDNWLIDLSRRGVQSMDLRSTYLLSIHSSIFSFSHLVTLKLHVCYIPAVPVGFAGFPALKELSLEDAEFSENEVLEAIIGGSPLLDVLDLSDVYIPVDEVCVIEATNLRSLTIIRGVFMPGTILGSCRVVSTTPPLIWTPMRTRMILENSLPELLMLGSSLSLRSTIRYILYIHILSP
ncbi:hypothetical protein BAE44_0023934 [Dichanthelium oligosanthes]|uniref:F-box domain-containing protein n=1 Tax=Dichanthelium oligosanthes TaxID=888268 RepID=A0A1E5UQ96_9POAL|nr:hypothetical protein BAE44_0023934 [Dichanthelium oligosanthes]